MRASHYNRNKINIKIFDSINTLVNENILPLKYSPLCYNFTFNGGALDSKMGIEVAKTTVIVTPEGRHLLPDLPEGKSFKSIHLYRKYDFTNKKRGDKIVVRANDDTYYETALFEVDTFHRITNLSAVGKDCSVSYRYNGEDVFILSSENGFFYVYNGASLTTVTDAPKITSMCVHAERVFATTGGEKNSVWFSDDFNPTNWKVTGTTAGFINFDDDGGAVVKVMTFLDYVYVFREYGIMRLSVYGAQQDFSVSKLYVSAGRIYPDTITFCGDRIMFLAEDGIYVFDGYSVRPLAPSLKQFLPLKKSTAVACYMDGKYYLAMRLDYGTNNMPFILVENGYYINNSMVIYELAENRFSIMRGVDINSLTSIKVHHEASVLATFNYDNSKKIGRIVKNGKVFADVLPKYWTTAETDLGYPSREKSIREVSFLTSGDCTLGIELDGITSEYAVVGSARPQKIIVNQKGCVVRLYIKSGAVAINITAPTVVVDIV